MQELSKEGLQVLNGGAKAARGGECAIFLMELTMGLGVGVIMGGAGIIFGIGFVVGGLSSDSNPC